jgi:hypothetical protein
VDVSGMSRAAPRLRRAEGRVGDLTGPQQSESPSGFVSCSRVWRGDLAKPGAGSSPGSKVARLALRIRIPAKARKDIDARSARDEGLRQTESAAQGISFADAVKRTHRKVLAMSQGT